MQKEIKIINYKKNNKLIVNNKVKNNLYFRIITIQIFKLFKIPQKYNNKQELKNQVLILKIHKENPELKKIINKLKIWIILNWVKLQFMKMKNKVKKYLVKNNIVVIFKN